MRSAADTRKRTAAERLLALENGEKEPTRSILQKVADKDRRSLLVFHLNAPPPTGDRGSSVVFAPGPTIPSGFPCLIHVPPISTPPASRICPAGVGLNSFVVGIDSVGIADIDCLCDATVAKQYPSRHLGRAHPPYVAWQVAASWF